MIAIKQSMAALKAKIHHISKKTETHDLKGIHDVFKRLVHCSSNGRADTEIIHMLHANPLSSVC